MWFIGRWIISLIAVSEVTKPFAFVTGKEVPTTRSLALFHTGTVGIPFAPDHNEVSIPKYEALERTDAFAMVDE